MGQFSVAFDLMAVVLAKFSLFGLEQVAICRIDPDRQLDLDFAGAGNEGRVVTDRRRSLKPDTRRLKTSLGEEGARQCSRFSFLANHLPPLR